MQKTAIINKCKIGANPLRVMLIAAFRQWVIAAIIAKDVRNRNIAASFIATSWKISVRISATDPQ